MILKFGMLIGIIFNFIRKFIYRRLLIRKFNFIPKVVLLQFRNDITLCVGILIELGDIENLEAVYLAQKVKII